MNTDLTAAPFLNKIESFGKLTAKDRELIKSLSARARSVENNEDLALEGDQMEEVLVLLRGFACCYKIQPSTGARQIVAYMLPGDICGLQASVLGAIDYSVTTLTKSQIAFLPQGLVERLPKEHPSMNTALWRAALHDEGILREWLIGFGCRTSLKRIAHLLCEIATRLQLVGLADDNTFDFPITQTELGETVGLTVVHVNRILQRLRRDGLITLKGGRLTIHNLRSLKKLARFRPNYLMEGRLNAVPVGPRSMSPISIVA